MPWLTTKASVRSDRGAIGQYSIFVVEYFQSARVFGFPLGGAVSARYQNYHLVRRIHAHLMSIDSEIERRRLFYRGKNCSVRRQAVDSQSARIVVGDQQ